jgi:transcriptional antiterminator RfaH
VRTQPKREHIATANLRRAARLAVFNPRLRSRKLTRRGPVWFTDSVFPGYVFVQFVLAKQLDAVRYLDGVSAVVHFGDRFPAVSDAVIDDLRLHFGTDDVTECAGELRVGDEVLIARGPFCGLTARVVRAMPGSQRVRVLLDFLGRPTPADLDQQDAVLKQPPVRQMLGIESQAPGLNAV